MPTVVTGLGPFTAAWIPAPDQPTATFPVYIDAVQVAEAPAGATTIPFMLPTYGGHLLEVSAKVDGRESPTKAALDLMAGLGIDPACVAPLGAHAPAIFVTGVSVTTGRPGSRSFVSYQLGGPDRVVELAAQIDGVDQLPIGRATGPTDDLKPFGSLWFVQPAPGPHVVGVRLLTAFGCALVRTSGTPFVVSLR